jgi:hypothetical protein
MNLPEIIESVRLNEKLWSTDESAMLTIYDALVRAEMATVKNRELSFELAGVISDVVFGNGFDSVCLDTVKRVYGDMKDD